MVVTRKNALSSAIYLILVMCCIAGLFATLGALFIAALQVIVYAGAIMVVVIFVIMLLNLRKDEFEYDRRMIQKYLGLAFAALILMQAVFIVSWAMRGYGDVPSNEISKVESADNVIQQEKYLSAESVAETLFSRYAYPFEITSILLLAAIVGAMVISKKKLIDEDDSKSEGQI